MTDAPAKSWAGVVERSWNKNLLLVALLELTYDCNLDCVFCYNDRALPGARLGVEEWQRVLDELAAMGVLNVVLSGGEPMVHKDFWRIGAYARQLGFVVRIKTNGHLLRGPALTRLREEIDPFVIDISLHGASAAVHDRQTRVPGSFERLKANLAEMHEAGLRVRLNCTLTTYNEGDIDGMFAIASALGMTLTIDPDVTPRDDGDTSPLALAASTAGLRALMAFGLAQSQKGAPAVDAAPATAAPAHGDDCASGGSAKHCGAGSSTICIDPVGNILPCVQWRRAVGHVNDGIASVWSSARGLDEIRALTVDVKTMLAAQGERGAHMGFCPGTAESRGGSPLAPYDASQKRAEAALVVHGRLRVLP